MTILRDCPSGASNAVEWAEDFGLNLPVWCDDELAVWTAVDMGRYKPQIVVIDRSMTVVLKENDIDAFERGEEAVIDAL